MALGAALLTVACGDQPDWDDADYVNVYVAAMEALRLEVGADTMVVEPRVRFLVEEEGAFTMGDFSEFEEPALTRALRLSPRIAVCAFQPHGGCDASEHPRRATLSLIRPLEQREAGLMASWVDNGRTPVLTRLLRLQLRYAGGTWRVVSVREAVF